MSNETEDRVMVMQRVRCPDGTMLFSRHVHDYQTHEDKVTGEHYMIDGGPEYSRQSVNKVPFTRMDIYDDSPHSDVREIVQWGTYGKNADQPHKVVVLKDMSTDHVKAVLKNCPGAYPYIRNAMEAELVYRESDGVEHEPSWLES